MTIQEEITKLVSNYYDSVSREHGITMPEVQTMFILYIGFTSTVKVGIVSMRGLAGIFSSTKGIGFKEFVDLFVKVNELDGVDYYEVDTLLINAAAAMMTQDR